MSNVLLQASTSYKKQNGNLILTKRKNLNWQPSGGQGTPIKIDGSQITALFSSKEGSAKIILRVSAILKPGEPEQNLNFTFIAASSAVSDREHFKAGLSDVIAYHKLQREAAASTQATPEPPQASTSAQTLDQNFDATYGVGLRIRLLKQEPDLRALHEALVLTGQISEEEFWESREHLLQAEQQQQGQKQGRAATMVDARGELSNDGEIKVVVTPQLIADIFAQHPIVQRAYSENVPPVGLLSKLVLCLIVCSSIKPSSGSDSSRPSYTTRFEPRRGRRATPSRMTSSSTSTWKWMRMVRCPFPSASGVYTATDADPDNLESDHIYRLLDLAATAEDHGEVRSTLTT
jgi:hypothetical protein